MPITSKNSKIYYYQTSDNGVNAINSVGAMKNHLRAEIERCSCWRGDIKKFQENLDSKEFESFEVYVNEQIKKYLPEKIFEYDTITKVEKPFSIRIEILKDKFSRPKFKIHFESILEF